MPYRRKDEPRYVPEPKNPLCRSQWIHSYVLSEWRKAAGWQRWSWFHEKYIDYNHPDYPGKWVFTSFTHKEWAEIPGVDSIEEAIKVAIALERLDALTPAVEIEAPQIEVPSLT